MKKEKWHVILKIMSLILIISFIIRLGGDYYKITLGDDIFPFYVYIIIRALEFIIPSIIIFLSSKYFKKKYKNKEKK